MRRIQKLKFILNEFKTFKNFKKYNFFPKNEIEYKEVLNKKAKENDNDLNDINVSLLNKIGGFNSFYFFTSRNFFVEEWDVSKAKDFRNCFANCVVFNCDLSYWDVSNGTNFSYMFDRCYSFNQTILNFDFSNAEKLFGFFFKCDRFNRPVHSFKFSSRVNNLYNFFYGCFNFNQDVSMWDVSNIEDFSKMFFETKSFKQDLSEWDVSNAVEWDGIFTGSLMENYPELMPDMFQFSYIK